MEVTWAWDWTTAPHSYTDSNTTTSTKYTGRYWSFFLLMSPSSLRLDKRKRVNLKLLKWHRIRFEAFCFRLTISLTAISINLKLHFGQLPLCFVLCRGKLMFGLKSSRSTSTRIVSLFYLVLSMGNYFNWTRILQRQRCVSSLLFVFHVHL